MLKKLGLFVLVFLAIGLASLAFEQIVPTNTVQAASHNTSPLNSAAPASEETTASTPPTHPAVYAAAGLVTLLFGILAISPLLVDDSQSG